MKKKITTRAAVRKTASRKAVVSALVGGDAVHSGTWQQLA